MTDRDTPIAAYDSLRSILRALDEEEDDDLTPPSGQYGPEPCSVGIESGRPVARKLERVPASERGVHAGSAPASAEERKRHRLVGSPFLVMSAAGKVFTGAPARVSILGLLVAGAILLPSPTDELAPRVAIEEELRLVAIRQADPAAIAETIAVDDVDPSGRVAEFAGLAQKAFAAAISALDSNNQSSREAAQISEWTSMAVAPGVPPAATMGASQSPDAAPGGMLGLVD